MGVSYNFQFQICVEMNHWNLLHCCLHYCPHFTGVKTSWIHSPAGECVCFSVMAASVLPYDTILLCEVAWTYTTINKYSGIKPFLGCFCLNGVSLLVMMCFCSAHCSQHHNYFSRLVLAFDLQEPHLVGLFRVQTVTKWQLSSVYHGHYDSQRSLCSNTTCGPKLAWSP